MTSIKNVAVGDLIGYTFGNTPVFGRVTGFTKTQIKCIEIDADLITPKKRRDGKAATFNLQKDGGYRIGSPYNRYELISEEEAIARIERAKLEAAARKAEQAAQQTAFEAKVAARMEAMRAGYEARQCLNESLGVWSMSTTNDHGRDVVIIWSTEQVEEYDWDADTSEARLESRIRMSITYWYRDYWNGEDQGVRGSISTSGSGPDELTVLASHPYS